MREERGSYATHRQVRRHKGSTRGRPSLTQTAANGLNDDGGKLTDDEVALETESTAWTVDFAHKGTKHIFTRITLPFVLLTLEGGEEGGSPLRGSSRFLPSLRSIPLERDVP